MACGIEIMLIEKADKHNPAVAEQQTSVLDAVIGAREEHRRSPSQAAPSGGVMREAEIAAWDGRDGTLADGLSARLAISCLVRPDAGDQVLVWVGEAGSEALVLAVLRRPLESARMVMATPGPLSIESPDIAISTGDLSILSENFVTESKNRHAIEDVRTETSRIRVAQVGTDVRKAGRVDDDIEGSFVQRMGLWISNTTKEARLRARAFMFD